MGSERKIRSTRTNFGRANYPNPRSHVRAPRQQRRRSMWARILLMILLAFCATSASAAEEPVDAARAHQLAVKLAGFGGRTCRDWLSSASHQLEGAVWIYGFWSGLNYVAAASEQKQSQASSADMLDAVEKVCRREPSQVLASAVWVAYVGHSAAHGR